MTIEQIGVFTPEQARELWQDYLTRKQSNPQMQKNYPQRRELQETSPHRVFVKNTESETVPAYGCLRITGTAESGGRMALTVEKPSSTDGEFVFNGPYPIAASGVGWAYRFGVVNMLGNAPASANATYLPIINAWQIEEGNGPFVVFGEDTTITGGLIGRFVGGGESGSKIISFAIISSDPTLRSAQVEIRQRSFTGTVFGSTLDDTVVTVYDTDGCYLNEPNVDLTGRNGKAVLMYVDAEAEAAHFPDYDVPTQYWNVLSLCCPNVVCE